jgi:hypothetical protein
MRLGKCVGAVLAGWMLMHAAHATGTAFTYQGALKVAGAPANGSYDLRFDVYDTSGGPSPIAGSAPVLVDNVLVVDGVFTAQLDFGASVFTGGPVFLEVGVREAAAGGPGNFTGFSALTPRQPVTPTPYAVQAQTVADDAIASGAIADASITAADVDTSQIQRRSATLATACTAAGLSIKSIASDGTPTCDSGPSVTAPLLKTGNDISLPGAAAFASKDGTAGNQSFDGNTLHLDYANNRVGVRTTAPTTELDVDGFVSADRYRLRNSEHGYYNVTGAAFIPAATNPVNWVQAVNGYGYLQGSTGGSPILTAPVVLPLGALVDRLACHWMDNDADSRFNELEITLWRRGRLELSATQVAQIVAVDTITSPSMFGAEVGTTATSVESEDHYYLRAALDVAANNSSDVRLYGCSVRYIYSELRF